jgi:hypothetical protein
MFSNIAFNWSMVIVFPKIVWLIFGVSVALPQFDSRCTPSEAA